MTQKTKQSREEFEQMRSAFELEMIDNHYYSPADFRDAGLQSDGSFIDDDLNDAVVIWDAAWIAARRAQVVTIEPTQEMLDVLISTTHATDDPMQGLRAALAVAPQAQPPDPVAVVTGIEYEQTSMRSRFKRRCDITTLNIEHVEVGDKLFTERQLLCAIASVSQEKRSQCPVNAGTHKPIEALHKIHEPTNPNQPLGN